MSIVTVVDIFGDLWIQCNSLFRVLQFSNPTEILYDRKHYRYYSDLLLSGENSIPSESSVTKYVNIVGARELLRNIKSEAECEEFIQSLAPNLTSPDKGNKRTFNDLMREDLVELKFKYETQLARKDFEIKELTLKHQQEIAELKSLIGKEASNNAVKKFIDVLDRNFLLTPKMDNINPEKTNVIGFYLNVKTGNYHVYRLQTKTLFHHYPYIIREKGGMIETGYETCRREISNILMGNPIVVGHGVNTWNTFRCYERADFAFGLNFTNNKHTSFVLLTENELREKYRLFLAIMSGHVLMVIPPIYLANLAYYLESFTRSKFIDEQNCIDRALIPDIWTLRQSMYDFVNVKSLKAISELVDMYNVEIVEK